MATRIKTDQPEARRATLRRVLTTTPTAVLEPPYFSIPIVNEDVAIIDAAEPEPGDRELRAGEILFASPIHLTNVTPNAQTVNIEIVGETAPNTFLVSGARIPGNETLTVALGPISLFKRDLASPSADGDRLRVSASAGSAIHMTVTYIEREALDHAPDTEDTP